MIPDMQIERVAAPEVLRKPIFVDFSVQTYLSGAPTDPPECGFVNQRERKSQNHINSFLVTVMG